MKARIRWLTIERQVLRCIFTLTISSLDIISAQFDCFTPDLYKRVCQIKHILPRRRKHVVIVI